MDWDTILDELIRGLHPEYVPIECVIMAKYIDRYGDEHIVRGDDLAKFMAGPQKYYAREAHVVLDVSKIRYIMRTTIVKFLIDLSESVIKNDITNRRNE